MLLCLRTRFFKSQHGVALIEFAIVFPFFFLLLFGGIEVARLILIQQKLEKAGYVLADITTQFTPATPTNAAGEISEAEVTTNVFAQLDRIMNPYGASRNQVAILTSIEKLNGNLTIRWQIAGGGSLAGCDNASPQTCVRSIVNNRVPGDINPAVRGTTPNFPSAEAAQIALFVPTINPRANIIVSEVFYRYEPIFQGLLEDVGTAGGTGFAGFNFFVPPRIYVKRTYFTPRNGNLFDLPPSFPVT